MSAWPRALVAAVVGVWRHLWAGYWRDQQDLRHLTEPSLGSWTWSPVAQTQASVGHGKHLSLSSSSGRYRSCSSGDVGQDRG